MRTHVLAVALLAVTALPAQVFVVDAAGGAGSHFTDLPTAIAAVPSGSTLRVRAGRYPGCAVQAKGLAIVGEGSVTVASCTVARTAATQRILLRNLQLEAGLSITDAAGPVAIEACGIPAVFWPGVTIERSAQVRLLACQSAGAWGSMPAIVMTDATVEVARCQVVGGYGTGLWSGSKAGVLALRSRCTLVDSRVTGGAGGDANCWRGLVTPATPGHPGCELEATILLVCESVIVGGVGGAAAACTPGALGGAGVAAGRNCAVFVFGALPTGGGSSGGNGLPRGPAYRLGPGSSIVHDRNVGTPVAWVTGTQARAQTVQVELRAAPASVAVLAFSYTGLAVPLEPFGVGSVLLQPALISAAFPVPSTGAFALPLRLPATLPLSEIYTGQMLTWQPRGVFASNTFPLLVAQ